MKSTKKFLFLLSILSIFWQFVIIKNVFAASLGDVVINEIAWAGSVDSSSDEWIELYNKTNQSIDLSGWYIKDDVTTVYKITSGVIAPKSYFVVEDNENAVSNTNAHSLISLSLANAGDSLVLYDASNNVVDTVNAAGAAWYAGNATSKATMERIDPQNLTDAASNWATATNNNGSLASKGTLILGTPSAVNSNYGGQGPSVVVKPAELSVANGDDISISIEANDVADLYAYGLEVNYDPDVLRYKSIQEGNFLKIDNVTTAFNAALKNSQEGTLVVGNARLLNPSKGVDGNGELFKVDFEIVGDDGENSLINFGNGSFLADSTGDLITRFDTGKIIIGGSNITPISNVKIIEGVDRYSLKMSWDAPSNGADSYIIKKKGVDGVFINLGTVTTTNFIDDDNVTNGGKLIPGLTYNYEIISVKDGKEASPISISGVDNRGIKGDNDRNDRVDGKDIEKLARGYGSDFGDEEYNALIDTNFDGTIDGKDLIDIGLNFGKIY